MNKDFLAILGIATLAIIFSINPKVGGILIAVVVLGMLLQFERITNGLSN